MEFTLDNIKTVVNYLKSKMVRGFFSNITVINSRDFLISFSNSRDEKFLISLNHNCPFMSPVKVNESVPTITGQINDNLRKYIRDSQLLDVDLINDDRLVKLTISKSNEFFDKETRYVILEMISHRSNLVIINEKGIIEFALHYTTLESSHPVMKGMFYQPTDKKAFVDRKEDTKSLDDIRRMGEQYLFDARDKRLKEKYQPLLKHFKSRLKSLDSKEKTIKHELAKAENNLSYLDIGNTLLAYSNSLDDVLNYVKDNNLSYDTELSIGQNANLYFKKYKKAKRTIEMDHIELVKCQKEREEISYLLSNLSFLNDDDLLELAEQYMPHKFKTQTNKKKKHNISFITVDDTKIYYGKTALQNEYLTFTLATRDATFFHIKDYTGAHVVVMEDDPSKDVMKAASEICLILSNKEAGDIQFTSIRNVKKGTERGQAILKEYQTITLKKVDAETINLLKNN